MRRSYLLLLMAVCACRRAAPERLRPSSPLTVVNIPRQWDDTGTTSTLHIVVRDVRMPIQPVEAAEVRLGSADTPRLITDARGYARRDSLAAGEYELYVRRLGFVPLRTRIRLARGCDAWAEVYLTVDPCDIGDCPPIVPARVTLSTCAPAV
jgi:hypothetical protein